MSTKWEMGNYYNIKARKNHQTQSVDGAYCLLSQKSGAPCVFPSCLAPFKKLCIFSRLSTTSLRLSMVRAPFITRLLSLSLLLSYILNSLPLEMISSTLFHFFPSFYFPTFLQGISPFSDIIHIAHSYNRISYHIHTVHSIWNHSIHSFSPIPSFLHLPSFLVPFSFVA